MYIIYMVVKKKKLVGTKIIYFLYINVRKGEIYIYIKKIKILGDIKEGAKVLGFGSSLYF